MIKKIIFVGLLINILASCSTKPTPEVEEKAKKEATVFEKYMLAYSTDSVTMNGYITYNDTVTEKRPGVLVVHEWWGHNDYAQKRADMLAELGYVAFAIDMYGDGKEAKHPSDASGYAGEVMGNFDEAKARFAKALEILKTDPHVDTTKIAAIGYCFGGSVVLSMANAGFDLDAVAAFHSGLELPIDPTDSVKAKVLICNGADDPFITAEQAETYKEKLNKAGVDYNYVVYENTTHAYTNPEADALGKKFDLPLKYNKESDEKAWNELKTLLEGVFNK